MNRWRVGPLASPGEIDAVIEIESESFTNPWTREMYFAELNNPGVSFFYVARGADGRIVGFCAFWRVADELHINNLAVTPGWRRQGVASELLAHVLSEGGQLGVRRATLEVRRSNQPALQLYERFGFSVAGVRPGYYSEPVEDALILWKEGLANP